MRNGLVGTKQKEMIILHIIMFMGIMLMLDKVCNAISEVLAELKKMNKNK